MIWISIQLMTAIDLLILAVGAYVGFQIYKNIKRTRISGNFISQYLIAAGLFVIAIFFATDLYMMWVMRHFVGMKAAMAAMENLHLNISWFVIPFAVCTIALGLLRVNETMNTAFAQIIESEERLRGIMNSVVDSIITIDEKGIVGSFNHAASLMFGYTAEEMRGKNISVLMPDPYRNEHDQYLRNYTETGKARIVGIGLRELAGQHKDGSIFDMELAVSEFRLGENRIFIGAIRDISERKKQQARLEQAQKMEAIGQLTGGVAHDFNNILAIILGNLDLLSDRITDDEDAKKLTETAVSATLRGADLTQRLLAFSRKQTLQPKSTDINKSLSDATELMRRTLGEGIDIETVLAGGLWNAMIDENQLQNVLLNLALNARDAMSEGGKLTFETANSHLDQEYADQRQEVLPGQYVMIAVTDTGSGMPPEVLEQAFEPFFTTKDVGEGSGLGLSMVYGFAKQSGGHVAIYSEPGDGTTVKLYLPRTTSANTNGHKTTETQKPAMPAGDETILVVEDDQDVRTFVATALEVLGYKILEAEDGPSAMALAEKAPKIDLLFTDVVLPQGMSGGDIAEEFKKLNPNLKVLFTSGYTENAIVHQGRLDAGVELLAKPYTRETLAKRVRATLDSQ